MRLTNFAGRILYLVQRNKRRIPTIIKQNEIIPTIAYYSNTLQLGGSEVYLKDILKNVDFKKYKILFIGPHKHPLREWINTQPQIQSINLDGVLNIVSAHPLENKQLDASNEKSSSPNSVKNLWHRHVPASLKLFIGTLKDIRRLKKFFKKLSVDLIHFNDTGCEPPVIAARLAGIPKIIGTFHVEPAYERQKTDWAHRLIEYFSTRCLHLGVSVSAAVREAWVKRTGVSRDKIFVVYNGIDLEKFKSLKTNKPAGLKEFNCSENDKIICVPARLHPMKGHHDLLAAVQQYFQNKTDIKFLLVGDGPLRQEIENFLKKNRLQDSVKILGFRKDIADIMRLSDLIVLPSISLEALPYVLIEAMACSKPVVATNFSGIPEVVEDNVTGLLVPRKNPQALADAINRLLENPQKAAGMGEAGRKRVETLFAQERMLDETFTLYESLLNG